MFGEKERISGYEGLVLEISLSSKRLFPFIKIQYEKKAPAFANVDNLNEKLQKHYGKIFESTSEFQKVLEEESSISLPGKPLIEFIVNEKQFQTRIVCLDDETF